MAYKLLHVYWSCIYISTKIFSPQNVSKTVYYLRNLKPGFFRILDCFTKILKLVFFKHYFSKPWRGQKIFVLKKLARRLRIMWGCGDIQEAIVANWLRRNCNCKKNEFVVRCMYFFVVFKLSNSCTAEIISQVKTIRYPSLWEAIHWSIVKYLQKFLVNKLIISEISNFLKFLKSYYWKLLTDSFLNWLKIIQKLQRRYFLKISS